MCADAVQADRCEPGRLAVTTQLASRVLPQGCVTPLTDSHRLPGRSVGVSSEDLFAGAGWYRILIPSFLCLHTWGFPSGPSISAIHGALKVEKIQENGRLSVCRRRSRSLSPQGREEKPTQRSLRSGPEDPHSVWPRPEVSVRSNPRRAHLSLRSSALLWVRWC